MGGGENTTPKSPNLTVFTTLHSPPPYNLRPVLYGASSISDAVMTYDVNRFPSFLAVQELS